MFCFRFQQLVSRIIKKTDTVNRIQNHVRHERIESARGQRIALYIKAITNNCLCGSVPTSC